MNIWLIAIVVGEMMTVVSAVLATYRNQSKVFWLFPLVVPLVLGFDALVWRARRELVSDRAANAVAEYATYWTWGARKERIESIVNYHTKSPASSWIGTAMISLFLGVITLLGVLNMERENKRKAADAPVTKKTPRGGTG